MDGAGERGRCMLCQPLLSEDDRRVCVCVFSRWLGLGWQEKRLYQNIHHFGLGAASRLQAREVCSHRYLGASVRLLINVI